MDFDINPAPGLLDALADASTLIVATDDGRNDNLVYARHAAAILASRLGAEMVLYDRSAETWTESPHTHRICDLATARQLDADHLVAQIEEAQALGADPVIAYQGSIPNFDGFHDAVRQTNADVIVAPTRLDHPKLADRLQVPGGDLIAQLRKIEGDRIIVVAEPDGTLILAE